MTSRAGSRPALVREYGIAALAAGLALLVRGVLPIQAGLSLYTLAVGAIAASGWYGGRGPGLLALAITTAGTLYWFIPPADSFRLPSDYALGLVLFIALGLVLIEFAAGRRRVQSALEESERRFRLMAETVPEMLWIESIAPREMMFASARYEEIWGRPLADLQRDPEVWIEAIHPDDREGVRSAYRRWLAGAGSDRFDAMFRIVRPDGANRWIRSRATLTRDERDRPHRAAGVAEDVTETKRASDAVAKAQAELIHVTRVTTMGQLAATIAHEANQPLAAIAANGGAALRYLAREPPNLDKAREAAADIVRDAKRATDVVAKVRALTRKGPGGKERVDVNRTIDEVVLLTRGEAQENHVVLETRLSADVPPVLADRVQVQQVLLNLILNAIEAMSRSGEGPRELIIRSAKEPPNDVVVTVADNGVGLDATTADRVFDAFYTTKPDGMGMGLAICRSIVHLNGGRIWATPNRPRGAAFHFTLPIAAGPASS